MSLISTTRSGGGPGRRASGVLVVGAAVALLAACGGSASSSAGGATSGGAGAAPAPGGAAYAGPVGAGEGTLNVLAWPGYAENGSTDPKVDWVNPFTKDTGCKVNVKTFATSAEAVQLFNTGGYDVVSASGDASLRLVYGGKIQPVNTALVPNYADVIDQLKKQPWNSVGETLYGIPHGRGANLLLFTKDKYPTPPTSWKDMFDASSPAKGKISPYDDSMSFADAAVYLMATQPDLGIKNPYSLDQKQFDAVVALAKVQKTLTAEYWADIVKQGTALASGTVLESQGWQITANMANAKGEKVGAVKPSEGSHGLVRHLDGRQGHQERQLRLQVARLDRLAQGERRGRRVLRRGAGQCQGLPADRRPQALRDLPRDRHRVLEERLVLDHPDRDVPRRPHRHEVCALRDLGAGVVGAARLSWRRLS